ncbi:hypothetical protein ASF30_11765 [Leifsonia sp. Leaf264]|nr:hypothetical protein [Leifsonia sp. Leaf264]KQO98934.1 hypothetical protein ASF30_11765 [Leifsonia sp. Leaf264]
MQAPAPIEATAAPEPKYKLSAHDRCDRKACGARAYAQVGIHTFNKAGEPIVGELLYCAHHYSQHEPALAARSSIASVVDEREALVESELARKGANPNGNGFS